MPPIYVCNILLKGNPSKSANIKKIIQELVKVFNRAGIPKEFLTDRGPNFQSTILKHQRAALGIKGVLTSLYYPDEWLNGRNESN